MKTTPAIQPRRLALAGVAIAALIVAACGTGSASPTPAPVATSFQEFRAGFCAAWESLFLAVGNPDTASGSELSDALDKAIVDGDAIAIEVAAGKVQDELEIGRSQVAYAAGWEPAAAPMAHMDRLFVGFEAMIEAQRAAASEGAAAAAGKGQAAFEAAGALDAWRAILTPASWSAVDASRPAGVSSENCGDLPVGM